LYDPSDSVLVASSQRQSANSRLVPAITLGGLTHGSPQFLPLRQETRLGIAQCPPTNLLGKLFSRRQRRSYRLQRRGQFVELESRERLCTDDRVLRAKSCDYQLGCEQHIELVDNRSNGNFDFARRIQLRVGRRIYERKPNFHDDLYADSDQRCRVGHVQRNRYRKQHRKQADDQLFHRQPDEHEFGFKQHTELVDHRSDERCDHAGKLYVRVGERFNQCEPHHDNDLHIDGNEWFRLVDFHGDSHNRKQRVRR
jgi:hypothetical protein